MNKIATTAADFAKVMAGVQAGDIITLPPLNLGRLEVDAARRRIFAGGKWISNIDIPADVTLYSPVPGETRFSRIICDGPGWCIDGLGPEPDAGGRGIDHVRAYTFIMRGPRQTARRLLVDNGDYRAWTMADWATIAYSPLLMQGPNFLVELSYFRGVYHGINSDRNSIGGTVRFCAVHGFAEDQARTQANGITVENCDFRDATSGLPGVHVGVATGFPTLAGGGRDDNGVLSNITLRRNTFIASVIPGAALSTTGQFGGGQHGEHAHYIVEDNLCIVQGWRGMGFVGLRDSIVRNNVVLLSVPVSAPDKLDQPPQANTVARMVFGFSTHSTNRQPSARNIITGNIANAIIFDPDPAAQTDYSNNLTLPVNEIDKVLPLFSANNYRPAWDIGCRNSVDAARGLMPWDWPDRSGDLYPTRPVELGGTGTTPPPVPPGSPDDDPKLPDDNPPASDQPAGSDPAPFPVPSGSGSEPPSNNDPTSGAPASNKPAMSEPPRTEPQPGEQTGLDQQSPPATDYSAEIAAIRAAVDALEARLKG